MTMMKNYYPLAIVAILAGIIGWSVSALGVNRNSEAVTPQVQTAPVSNQLVPTAPQPEQVVIEPIQSAAPEAVTVPTSIKAPTSVKRSASSRRRAVSQPAAETTAARNEESETASSSRLPVRERKSEMSNTAKTVIAIGGGAATGAIIGGLAGGKKGAAIGAIAGGGGGAIYSLIRKKQGKEVW